MAVNPVNTTEVEALYDVLIALAETTINEQYAAGRLVGAEFAEVLTSVVVTTMKESLSAVQEQPLKDAKALAMKVADYVALANSQRDIELKDAKKLLVAEQVQTEAAKVTSAGIDDAIRLAQKDNDVAIKGAQTNHIIKQKLTETAKALLTARQEAAYDDQLRVKLAKSLANVSGMYAAGGSISEALETRFKNAVNAI